jgi:hypothetical protein
MSTRFLRKKAKTLPSWQAHLPAFALTGGWNSENQPAGYRKRWHPPRPFPYT